MGDESMVSGMEPSGAAPGAVGAAAQADNIIKRISAYWIIIGSIPLVMFLMVAFPTVLYVKSIAEFVNAFYCNSKSCNHAATLTEAARGSGRQPCQDFFTYVCDAVKKHPPKPYKTDYEHDAKWMTNSRVVMTPPINTFPNRLTTACINADGSFVESTNTLPEYSIAPNPALIVDDIVDLVASASHNGIDLILHAELVHSEYKAAYDEPTIANHSYVDLEIGAPHIRMTDYYHYLGMTGMNMENIIKEILSDGLLGENREKLDSGAGESFIAKLLIPFLTEYHKFLEFCEDKDFNASPEMWDIDELTAHNAQAFHWDKFVKKMAPNNKRVLVRSPTYVAQLKYLLDSKFGAPVYLFYSWLRIDYNLKLFGPYMFAKDKPNKEVRARWCYEHNDWAYPMVFPYILHAVFATRWQVSLKLQDAKAKMSVSRYMHGAIQELISSVQKAYALSTHSSEKSRVGLFHKLNRMNIAIFGYNKTPDELDFDFVERVILENNRIPAPEEDFEENIARIPKIREAYMKKYWDVLTTKNFKLLLLRHPMMASDPVGSYDYGSNSIYFSVGPMRPFYHKESHVNALNYALFGYYYGQNLLKAMDNRGGYVKQGYNYPINWKGVYATERLRGVYTCLNPTAKNGTTARRATTVTNALTPGYRYYREQALKKASPKPEYRLDRDASTSMGQLYFFTVMRSMCHMTHNKDLYNDAFKNDRYFAQEFCKEGAKKPSELCYMWPTTRRKY